jgi:hypothetical protein
MLFTTPKKPQGKMKNQQGSRVELLIVMMDLNKFVIITLPHSKTQMCGHIKIKESFQDVDTPLKIIPLYL